MEKINYETLIGIDNQYGTPFYILHKNQYSININSFIDAFKQRYQKVILAHSFKTNYVPALCQLALREGCFAEVVSEMEYEMACKLGFKNIIFNGPIKRKAIFEEALKRGAIINLDSEYEVDMICNYKQTHPREEVKVGLRININLTDEHGNSTIQCGIRFGRFGFPKDILGKSIERLRTLGIKIVSLHGHTSTSDRAVLNYKIITQHMLDVCEKYQLNNLVYFDIGGGYFGAAPKGMNIKGKPTYDDYANCVIDELEKSDWFLAQKPWIVIEPGTSVVSNVFSYYTKVYQNKKVGNVNFIIVDGTVFDIKPTMHQNNLPHTLYKRNDISETKVYDVVGSTCMEKDVLLKGVELSCVTEGDYLQFDGVGAYTVSLTPTFINYLAPILIEDEGRYSLVRRRQNINDILNIYSLQY